MIGYYIHHQGRGHLHRALSIAEHTRTPVTGLSTLPQPAGWRGPWVQLADDAVPPAGPGGTANGRLHYVPTHHAGLCDRMSTIAGWIGDVRPTAFVVDVSVEVALLARLHGVPVITVAQPGIRDDAPHVLGYGISETILAPWPAGAPGIWRTPAPHPPVVEVGAISRFGPRPDTARPAQPGRCVVVLNGAGGGSVAAAVDKIRTATPDWEWTVLDRAAGTWVDDPWPLLCSAAVVVSHCGQNAVAEIAAARQPAILIPQERPFGEQTQLALALAAMPGIPAVIRSTWPEPAEWPGLLTAAAARDGSGWATWNDGRGSARAAALLDQYAPTSSPSTVVPAGIGAVPA